MIPAITKVLGALKPHGNRRLIAENAAWLFFGRAYRMVFALTVGIWIARYLGPESYGVLSYCLALLALFTPMATFGLQSIVVRDLVNMPDENGEICGSAGVAIITMSFVSFALLGGVIFMLKPDDALVQAIIWIFGFTFLFKVLEIAAYWFESRTLSKYIVWAQSTALTISALIKVAIILLGLPLIYIAIAFTIESILLSLGAVLAFRVWGPQQIRLAFSFERMSSLFRQALPMVLAALSVTVYMKIDQVMLGQMIGPEGVGHYAVAVALSEFWYIIPMVLVASVFPTLLTKRREDEAAFTEGFQGLYDFLATAGLAVSVMIFLFSEPIIHFLFGDAYAPASGVLRIHIWAFAFVGLGVASGQWLVANGLQVVVLQRTLAGAFTNVLLNLLLIPMYGIEGAAWSTLISYALASTFYDIVRKDTRAVFLMKMRAFIVPLAVRRSLTWLKAA